MIVVCEKDGRLILDFFEPSYSASGLVRIDDRKVASIDISSHIEAAVERVLAKRTTPPSDTGAG